MAADAAPRRDRVTREEYLAIQRQRDDELWLWDGELFEPQAASLDHERIVANLVGELRSKMLEGPCEPFPSAALRSVGRASTSPDESARPPSRARAPLGSGGCYAAPSWATPSDAVPSLRIPRSWITW